MAARKKATYQSKAVINKISATSRVSIKVGETFYTLEYSEERLIPEGAEITEERKILWDIVNGEVDAQVQDIYEMYDPIKKKKSK